jgi:hypothetical protein
MLVGVDVTAVTVSAASENCDRATANNQTFGRVTVGLRRSTEGLVLRKSRVWMNVFRCFLAEGEIGGTPCMRSHIFTHLATTISIAKPFVVKMKIEKEGLPRDSPAGLGAGGPRFESGRPDQKYLQYFLQLIKSVLHARPHCGIQADRRSEFVIRVIPKSSPQDKYSKTGRGRSAIQKLLNGRNLKKAHGVGEGETGGPHPLFRSSFWSKTGIGVSGAGIRGSCAEALAPLRMQSATMMGKYSLVGKAFLFN